jgi:hypothetical protein
MNRLCTGRRNGKIFQVILTYQITFGIISIVEGEWVSFTHERTTTMYDMYDDPEYDFDLDEQADEIYREELMGAILSGSSDPYGDAEYVRDAFYRRNGSRRGYSCYDENEW